MLSLRLRDGVASLTQERTLQLVWSKGLDIVGNPLVIPAMILILCAVFQQHAMQLLDVVLGNRNGLKAAEDHVHRVGIARNFLFIAAPERFAP